jgi:hypothetical protein
MKQPITCTECGESLGHKCGCSIAIERAAQLMATYHQGQYRAWEVAELEGIHLDDIAAGQKIADARQEEYRLNCRIGGAPEYGRLPESARAEMHADFRDAAEKREFAQGLIDGLESLAS